MKADEVIPIYRSNSLTPMADQVEEENLQLPTAVKAEENNILLQSQQSGRWCSQVLKDKASMPRKRRSPTRVGWTCQPGKAAVLGEEATLSQNFDC